MSGWLKKMSFGSKPLKTAEDFTNNVNIIKNATSDVAPIDEAIKHLPYKQSGDEILVGNARFRQIEPKFRKGELRSAFNDANVSPSFSASDEAILKKRIKAEAPDIDIADLEVKQAASRKFHEELAVKPKDGADLESKLSRKGKEKTKSIYAKILTASAAGATVFGMFAAMKLTGEVFEDVAKATNERNGCYMVYKNTETTACKIVSRSCGSGTAGAVPCNDAVMANTKSNIYIMVHEFFNTNNESALDAMADDGIDLGDPKDPDYTLQNSENIHKLTAFYDEWYGDSTHVPTAVPCEIASQTTGCVACDPTMPTNHVSYTSTELLDGNLTYRCIQDSNVIDTLTDIATTMGIDIFGASGDSISGSFQGNFLWTVLIILVLICATALAVKFIPRKSKDKEPNAPGEVKHDDMMSNTGRGQNINNQLYTPPQSSTQIT